MKSATDLGFSSKLIPNYTNKIIEKVYDRKQEIYKNNMSNISVHTYLKYIIETTSKNIKLSLATTVAKIAAKNVLKVINMENMFDLIITGDDVKK